MVDHCNSETAIPGDLKARLGGHNGRPLRRAAPLPPLQRHLCCVGDSDSRPIRAPSLHLQLGLADVELVQHLARGVAHLVDELRR